MTNTNWYLLSMTMSIIAASASCVVAGYYWEFGPLWIAFLWTAIAVSNVWSFVAQRRHV